MCLLSIILLEELALLSHGSVVYGWQSAAPDFPAVISFYADT